MGFNSTEVSYQFGQHGSGHVKANASDLKPPHNKVVVAITMLENVKFDATTGLVADSSYASNQVDAAETPGDGIAYIGTQTQTRANGLDQSDNSAESVPIAATVEFPKGVTIYGRWNRVSLAADYTHGIICYYGPA